MTPADMLAALAVLVLVVVAAVGCRALPKPVQKPKLPQISLVGPTGSMRPAFDLLDLVEVEDAPFDSLKVGDVVIRRITAFQTVMHRIVADGRAGNGERYFVTAGDALPKRDFGFMDRDTYFGRVRLVKKAPPLKL